MKKFLVVVVALMVFFTGACASDPASSGGTNHPSRERDIVCTVTDKDRTTEKDTNGNSTSVYRVYTAECDVLEISDTFSHWDSASRYNQITVGKKYEFHVRGFRRPMWSTFPNILTIHEVQ